MGKVCITLTKLRLMVGLGGWVFSKGAFEGLAMALELGLLGTMVAPEKRIGGRDGGMKESL